MAPYQPANVVATNAIGSASLSLPGRGPVLREAGGFPAIFFAIVSIGVIGLYIAYIIPVFLRLRQGDELRAGAVDLGRWNDVIGLDRGGGGSSSSASTSCCPSSA